MIQGMTEAVTRGHRPIGPGLYARRMEEPVLTRPGRTTRFNRLFGQRHSGRDSGNGKYTPSHTGRFEEALVCTRQLLNVLLNELPHTRGDHLRHRVKITVDAPGGLVGYQDALAHQLINKRDEK